MSKTIGVENFRVFKDFTEFEIRPITSLTGPNNSGKSSFTKLLMLLKNGIQNFNFTSGSHNLESFEKVLNWDANKESITLEFACSIPILSDSFRTQFEISNGEISKIIIKSPEDVLLSVEFEEDRSMIEYGSIGFLQSFNLNIHYLIDMIYKKKILVEVGTTRKENGFDRYKTKPLEEFDVNEAFDELALSELNNVLFNSVEFFDQIKAFQVRNQALISEIESLPKDYLLYDISLFGAPPSEDQKEIIRDIQNEVFSNILFSSNIGMKIGAKDFKKNFHLLIEMFNSNANYYISKRLKEHFGVEDLEIQESKLGRLIFKEHIFQDSFEDFKANPRHIRMEDIDNVRHIRFLETLFDQFKSIQFELSYYLDNIFYISPNRGNQQRVLMNSSENEIDEIVVEFSKLHKSNQNLPFIKEALQILDINGDLEIKRFENFISVLSLNRDHKNVTLADLGYGYSQIIPILLKIVLVNQGFNSRSTLIIEEPEANLHPDLQSKLADIFSLSLDEYPNLNFIIETHSEYLIRKLQYLTAKKELSPEQSVIYYFNADKYVSREEPKVKKIEITSTGNLTDTFGPGFYDEATKLKFDLMQINKEQSN